MTDDRERECISDYITESPDQSTASGILIHMWQQNCSVFKSVWVLFSAICHWNPANFDSVISLLGIYSNEIIINSYKILKYSIIYKREK